MRLLHVFLIVMAIYYVVNMAWAHIPEDLTVVRVYSVSHGKKTASCYVFMGSITGRHRFTSCGMVLQS
jgi:hypothetical protein